MTRQRLCHALLLAIAVAVGAGTAYAAPPAVAPPGRGVDRYGALVPDFASAYTGSLRGLWVLSFGYAALDAMLNMSLAYGLTPAFVSEAWISTLSVDLSLRPYQLRRGAWGVVPAYLAVGVMYVLDDDFFLGGPDAHPAGYYPPSALHLTLHAGFELAVSTPGAVLARHAVFAELGTTGHGIRVLFSNLRTVGVVDVLGPGFGYRVGF